MKKKFTEEQYQIIVELQRDSYPDSIITGGKVGVPFKSSLTGRLYRFVTDNGLDNEVVALANPITRKWAHEKFVEKEKKYYWTSKKQFPNGSFKVLVHSAPGYIMDAYCSFPEKNNLDLFTEKEVIESGYNPDMFVKEEPLPF